MPRSVASRPGCQSPPDATPRAMEHGGVRVELLPRTSYEVRYTPASPVIGFAFETQAGMHAFASDRRTAFRTHPNSLAYIPAGCEVMSSSERGGEYLLVRRGDDAFCPHRPGPRFNDKVVPSILGAASALRRMLIRGEPVEVLAFEAAVIALHEAVGAIHTGCPCACETRCRITPQRLRVIDEMIEARLDGPLTITEIAAALGLSPGYFIRAFRSAVGTTPHDYIVEKRLSRARVLLRTTPSGLAPIAAACGFASHAHMSAQFRQRFGVTPSRFREGG